MSDDYAFTVDELVMLDMSSYVPLYVQLGECIAKLIRKRRNRVVGKLLPSEAECVQRLQISRPTVRQAMSYLISQGLIMREKGRGTFVAPPKLEHDVSHAFEDDMHASHRSVAYSLLGWELVVPPAAVAAVFAGSGEGEYYLLRRTRSVEGEIVGIEERYLPAKIGVQLKTIDLGRYPILTLLRRVVGQKPTRLDVEVSSIAAEKSTAHILKVKPGAPLLLRRTTFLTYDGHPLMHGTVTFLAERYTFRFSVNYSASSG